MDVPESVYKHLVRIAEEEYGDSSPQSIGLLMSENLNEVLDRSLRKRLVQDRKVSREEVIAMIRKHGEGKEPEEYDRL
jgi:hypothetical protein